MDEQAKADALQAMADRRVQAMQDRLRRDIALRLLDANGQVTAAQIDDAFAAEWEPPNGATLANAIAAKASAAVAHARRQVESARDSVTRAQDKVRKFEDLLARAQADCDEVCGWPAAAEAALAEAEELAQYAASTGDARSAPPSEDAAAAAGVAEGRSA